MPETGERRAAPPRRSRTAEFYEKLVQTFVSAIQARREGIFEIDLQLRPYGKSGSMAVSLEGFRRYFAPEGPAWAYERQALVKLRPIAGDPELGQQVAALRDAFVYAGEVVARAWMKVAAEATMKVAAEATMRVAEAAMRVVALPSTLPPCALCASARSGTW